MEITDVTVHTLSLDEVEYVADATQDAAILEVETDEGITGIGEADSSPAVVEAVVNAPDSWERSRGLEGILLGRDPFEVERLWQDMYDGTYYYGRKGAALSAISGIDMALWDIIGKANGSPIHELLGGKYKDSVRAYASDLFPEDPTDTDDVRRKAERAVEEGFTAIKYGWGGFGESRTHDRELVGAARDVVGEQFDIMVDAGLVWDDDVKRAIKGINELDEEFDLFWAEEPVYAENFSGYERISEACRTRIVGGEHEYTVSGFTDLITRGRVDGVQPDVSRSGGFTQLRHVASVAANNGIPMIPHAYSTDILVAANLHLAAAHRNVPLLEYCVEDSPLRWDLVEEEFPVEDGYVSVPSGPGLGVSLDRDVLAEYSVDLLT